MNFLSFLVLAFTSVFIIVNPLAAVLTFQSLTEGYPVQEKQYIARRAVIVACLLAIIFALAGELILRLFGITADNLRVAGGILLFLISIDMLHARTSREGMTPEEITDATRRRDISIFPIATPLLTGPGAITTIIVLMRTGPSFSYKAATLLAVLTTFTVTYTVFFYADRIMRVLGVTAALVINRLMGLMLAAISVNFVATGAWNIYLSFK
jgi:multiple antibiotic resistance protein